MKNFEDFKREVIAEIKANPHLYQSMCRRMVRKIEEQAAEVERLGAEVGALQRQHNIMRLALERIEGAKGLSEAQVWARVANKEVDGVLPIRESAEVARLRGLLDVASCRVPHIYAGDCPDPHSMTRRDPHCPACQILMQIESQS